jgi:hypothetical protein
MSQTINCKQCKKDFVVDDEELALIEKLSPTVGGIKLDIPAPTQCFSCRAKRRLGWRNERSLYNRKSDLSDNNIVSMYPAGSKYPVYSAEEWWGDSWDDKSYAQDFDFTKSFFKQFDELNLKTPKIALLNNNPENSDYINRAQDNKDSYMSFDLGWNESVLYCRSVYNSNNLTDCTFTRKSNYSYECLDCDNVTNCTYCIGSTNLSNCRYCYDLHSCQDCLFCTNLRNKQYHIENKPYSKEEYQEKMKEFDFGSYLKNQKYKEKFKEVTKNCIHRFANNIKCENCTGDYLENCKNVKYSFGAKNSENCRYMIDPERGKDSMNDCSSGGEGAELNYEIIGSGWPYNIKFCNASWHCSDSLYLSFCQYCKNCFGCSNMKRAEYCILNKQYSKEEYEQLVPKIVEYMKQAGEWGEFFPLNISEFGYNETVANEYFPTAKEEIIANSWIWRDKDDNLVPSSGYIIEDNIKDVKQDILEKVLVCEMTQRPYKIQGQELAFYINQNIPIPRKHPDQRHLERLSLRNAPRLYHRKCMNDTCTNEFETTYAPDRTEKVYCESCYQKEVV